MIIYRSFSSFFAKEERFGSFKSLVLLVAFAILATSNSYAQASFETIDGLCYLIDSDAKTATLTANPNGEKYTGDIVVSGKVKASNGVEYTVTSLGESCFYGCSGLTSITIPSSVTSLGKSCFQGCSGLTSITIPSSVTSLGKSCFAECLGLKSITIPSSVSSLGESCFLGCSGLTSITIPSSVTTLGSGCFSRCSGLTSINIPSSVTSLGSCCFEECSKLEKATFQGKLPQNTINCGLLSTCIFYVPKAYYQNYKDALGSKYSYIYPSKDDESGEDKPVEQCSVPFVSYADGKLTFACSTPNAEYHYTITDSDIASDAYCQDGIVKLYAAYNISAYATADGYKASDKATATLYWVEANLNNNTTNINQTATRGIIVTSNDGIVTLSGLNNSEIVRFYTVDGKQIGTAKAINGTASQAVSESIVIAKIGNQTIKIAVK